MSSNVHMVSVSFLHIRYVCVLMIEQILKILFVAFTLKHFKVYESATSKAPPIH